MRTRIFGKLVLAALVVIAVATATMDVAIRNSWEGSLRRQITLALTQKTALLANHVGDVARADLQQIVAADAKAGDARATVITSGGKVLADSEANPPEMENHATRPEFVAALHGGIGSNIRRSHTLGIEFLYVAAPVRGGAVRLAYPLSEIRQAVAEVRLTLAKASALALLVAVVLASIAAHLVARRLRRMMLFAERIASGDLSTRISDRFDDEIGQLASALDKTARQLERTFGDLENSRRQLETLLNSMQEPVIAISNDRKLLWVNGALRDLIPQPRLRESLLETIRDPEVLRAVEVSISRGETRSARAIAIVPGRAFQCTVAPMPNGGAVLVLHDLTEVERVEKTRRDFIANVSHELRTPLTSIEGYTETLLDSDLGGNASAREFLTVIRRNASRMSRLTEDLLKLARVESGEWKLEKHEVSAADLLQDAFTNFKGIAASNGRQLEIERSTDQQVSADPDAIQQVFANLIENAMKYAPAGTRILLGVKESGKQLEFYVRDFGSGIATEHLPRLFERFYRADKSRSREAGGTGLGLAIVKHIVLNHGGHVRVESSLNYGSTFYFSLPEVPAAVAVAH